MGKTIYVGNLPYQSTSRDLEDLFSPYGTVERADVISDRQTGRSRGFGFVEMSTDEEAQAAIQGLQNAQLMDRTLVINEARPRESRF
jgi:RNA recognition motif-containing protein